MSEVKPDVETVEILNRGSHDWTAVSYSHVGNVERQTMRCRRCGKVRIWETRTIYECVEEPGS